MTDTPIFDKAIAGLAEVDRLEQKLMTDQDQLDTDEAALETAETSDRQLWIDAYAKLKDAVAQNPSAPASSLDFTRLDGLVETAQSNLAADSATLEPPVAPVVPADPADGSVDVPGTVVTTDPTTGDTTETPGDTATSDGSGAVLPPADGSETPAVS